MKIFEGLGKPLWIALLLSAAFAATPVSATERGSAQDSAVAAACSKDLVFLGELPSHGESRAMQSKAAIARRLIERCGFDALVFEAPLYEFELARRPAGSAVPTAADLDSAMGLFWTTRELAPWRAWVASRWADGRLLVAGMDDQPSATSRLANRELPQLVAEALAVGRREDCERLVRRHLEWTYTDELPYDDAEKRKLAECSDAASAAVQREPGTSVDRAMLDAFARYMRRQLEQGVAPTRDDSMAAALFWQLHRWPPGTRVIVWTATVHAARGAHGKSDAPMGQYFGRMFGQRMMSIGFSAAGGTTSMAGAPLSALAEAPTDSIERLAIAGSTDPVFLSSKELKKWDGKRSRLFGAFATGAWSRLFDAVIVFPVEKAPSFPPRPARAG